MNSDGTAEKEGRRPPARRCRAKRACLRQAWSAGGDVADVAIFRRNLPQDVATDDSPEGESESRL
jgi:hypothetical protein